MKASNTSVFKFSNHIFLGELKLTKNSDKHFLVWSTGFNVCYSNNKRWCQRIYFRLTL